MKLTLLRHGYTEGNRRRLYYGSTDLPLLPEGWEALAVLREQGGYPTAARYYTSGMLRTEQTLLALYGPVPHTVLPGLREMDFGIFEMRTYEELKQDAAYQRWICGNIEDHVCPHGESGVGFPAGPAVTAGLRRREPGSRSTFPVASPGLFVRYRFSTRQRTTASNIKRGCSEIPNRYSPGFISAPAFYRCSLISRIPQASPKQRNRPRAARCRRVFCGYSPFLGQRLP